MFCLNPTNLILKIRRIQKRGVWKLQLFQVRLLIELQILLLRFNQILHFCLYFWNLLVNVRQRIYQIRILQHIAHRFGRCQLLHFQDIRDVNIQLLNVKKRQIKLEHFIVRTNQTMRKIQGVRLINNKSNFQGQKQHLKIEKILSANQLQSAKYQQFAICFKFKMENHQPKTYEIPQLDKECDMFEPVEPSLMAIQSQYVDQMLDWLIKEQIPPFVVTEDYKIRREQQSPEHQSEVQCMNIQDKILGYNRKDKSLMELARKFIQKFEGAPSNILVLDQVTTDLNVERRRIYDIINIMESLSVVSKIRKNVYQWKGLKKAVETIESFSEGDWPEDCEKTKKQRSLESLATEFLKLFSQRKTYLTLQEATRVILNEANQQVKKTKIRRLYDIVNVFKCLGLVEKVKNSKSFGGKPVYQWLGCKQLLKIIEEKQQAFSNTEEHDDTINSNSDLSSVKQQEMKDDHFKQNLKMDHKNTEFATKLSRGSDEKNQNFTLGLRDISNTENLTNRGNICRRNSVSFNKSTNKPVLSLKKQTSFTDTRQVATKQNMKHCQSQWKTDSTSVLTNLMGQFQLNEGHSFFFSLMKHLNNEGNRSISQISDKLTQLVWPSHTN